MKSILAALLIASSAHAACTDPPSAGVDWTGCVFPDGKDLRGVNLEIAKMSGAWLRFANLTGANLIKAELQGANFIGANLTGANLTAALMHDAKFYNANLERANLTGAAMIRVNLMGANLKGAKLSRATDGKRTCAPWSIEVCQ